MSLRHGCSLRCRFDHVCLVQFERDGLVSQRLAEFNFDRVHKRAARPALFAGGKLEQFSRLPPGNNECTGANRNTVRIAFEYQITRQC